MKMSDWIVLPPLPTWETAHPLLVHLPIGALAAVPVLAVWAMLAGANRRTVGWAVMLMLLVGTTGTVVAAMSGEEALEVAAAPGMAGKLLDEHGDMGELARNLFLGVTGAYAAITILSTILKDKLRRPIWIAAHALWMLGFCAAFLALANAGHMGGRLVHEFGVRATMEHK
jgi:uncharacterized membrane protein